LKILDQKSTWQYLNNYAAQAFVIFTVTWCVLGLGLEQKKIPMEIDP
jgi:hypothetical protein